MDQPKKSSIGGIPYVVILFLVVSTIPSLVSDVITRNKVNDVQQQVVKLQERSVQGAEATAAPTFVPTATPSATVTVVPAGKGTVVPFKTRAAQ